MFAYTGAVGADQCTCLIIGTLISDPDVYLSHYRYPVISDPDPGANPDRKPGSPCVPPVSHPFTPNHDRVTATPPTLAAN